MHTLTYHIPTISCEHCLRTIRTELGDLNGVKSVAGDLARKQITVTFEAPATAEQIEARLAEIDYPVQA